MSTIPAPQRELLPNTITRQWLFNRQCVMYSTKSTVRASVDTWAEAVIHDIHQWDATQPYFVLHDFSRILITPYNRHKAIQVCKQYPDTFRGRYALVLQNNILGRSIQVFTRRELSRIMPQLDGGFFFNLASAQNWIEQGLSKY